MSTPADYSVRKAEVEGVTLDTLSKLPQPLGDRVILKRVTAATKTPTGIILPEQAQKKSDRCAVIAVGPEANLDKNGKFKPMEAQIAFGDEALVQAFAGYNVEVEGTTFIVVRAEDILAVWRANGLKKVKAKG